MINLKDYADLIRSLVAEENAKDENWKWSVKSIGKTIAHIRWGYCEYGGGWDGKTTFTISAESPEAGEDSFGDSVITRHPWGEVIDYLFVGGKFPDAETPEAAITRAVRGIARVAHSQY